MDVLEKTALLKCLGNGRDVIVDVSPFDIGRCRTAKLIITDVNISRKHCQLKFTRDKTWIVEDLSSSGTFLNDDLVGKGNTVIIKYNDTIRLGPKECSFIWQFKTGYELGLPVSVRCDNIDSQSETIVQICNKKDSLQRRMIQNREQHLQMKIEKEKLHRDCLTQVRALEEKLKLESKSEDIQNIIYTVIEEEKKKVQDEMEKKLLKLKEKISENNVVEEELKAEVQKLQEMLGSEQVLWENKFLEEKKILEEKIKEQNEKLEFERLKANKICLIQDQELQDKLKQEEEEKKLLMEKLKEMEKAKQLLSQKLKESDELHSMEKARLEEKMKKELMKQEENIKALFQEQIDSLQKVQNDSDNLNAEEKKDAKNQHLLLELDRVKNTLVESETRQKLLEKELAQASSLQDEASKVKSNVLENIADLMETELQCSVCSELFVTAVTLNCTHTFCKYCIDMWKKKKKNCPICRKKITSENRSIVMDNYIDKMVENLSEEFKKRRMIVISDRRNAGAPIKKLKSNPSFSQMSDNLHSNSSVNLRTRTTGISASENERQFRRHSRNSSWC